VLRDYFGLPPDQVYDILRNSETTADGITKGINWVPESQRRRKLTDLVAEIDRAYDGAAMMEASLNEYRPKPAAQEAQNDAQTTKSAKPKSESRVTPPIPFPGKTPPDGHVWPPDDPLNPYTPNPTFPGGGGGPGSVPPSESLSMANEGQAAENFGKFVETRYTSDATEFRPGGGGGAAPILEGVVQGVFEAVVEGGGFGGIVFGNSVVQTPGLGRLISLTWIPAGDDERPQTGRIAFQFSQTSMGSTKLVHKFYGPVLLEDVYVAYRIIYTHEGLPEWSKGQGIGIMSLYDRQDYIDCEVNRPSNLSEYWRALLNPALINTDLGQSAEMVDSLPIVHSKFAAMIVGDDAPQLKDDVDEWLKTTRGTWKFIDRPMVIGSVGERITIRPAAPADLPGDAARFIDVRAFGENPWVALLQSLDNSSQSPFTAGFDRLFPQIVRGSHEFSRINGFAPVLALFRWARSSNATVMGPIASPVKIPTSEALLITKDAILPTKDMTPKKIRELDRHNTDKCLSEKTAKLPASQAGILIHEQSISKQAALELETAADTVAEMQGLIDRSQYIENLAKILARHTLAGQALINEHPLHIKRFFVEKFSPKNLADYDRLIEQIQAQRDIAEKQSKAYDEALRSALDDQALSRKVVEAGAPSDISQYDSIVEKKTAATEELKRLQAEDDKLDQSFADAEAFCVCGLSPGLRH
jgi:hypothetical protein